MPSYTFLGGQTMTYPDYRDDETQRMLVAVPDSPPYSMSQVNGGVSPPADGRWVQADSLPEPEPDPVPAPEPEPEPAPEGGVTDANA